MNDLALNALEAAAARVFAVLRIFGILFELVAVVVGHRWYCTPAHLIVPAVVAGWGIVFAASCLRAGLRRGIAAGELAVAMLLAATVPWALPPDVLREGLSWVLPRLVGASVVVAWCAPAVIWLPATATLAGLLMTSCLASGMQASTAAVMVAAMAFLSLLFTVVSSVARHGAIMADRSFARAAARQSVHALATARQRKLRESERILHDIVLNTLTGLAWGVSASSAQMVRTRCRHAATVCVDLLGTGYDGGDEAASPAARLDQVVEEARRAGLDVEISTTGQLDVPGDVRAALAATVREALSNVRRHANTSRAWVDIQANTGDVVITVRDEGVGFEPLDHDSERLGIRYSIIGRMADVGGSADVRSISGRGTTVTLHWSPRLAPEPALAADAVALECSYAWNATRAVGMGACLWQIGCGLLLLGRLAAYRHPLLVLGAWGISLALLARYVVLALGGRLRPVVVARLVVVVIGTQIVLGLSVRDGDLVGLRPVMFADVGATVLFVFGRPAGQWLAPVTLMAGTATAVISWRSAGDVTVLMRFGEFLYAQVALQTALSMFWRARHAMAGVTARTARAEAELIADRAAAVAVRHDRRLRLLHLADGPLPLLADLGAGRLDPQDDVVRERCARCAAALRRTLTRQLSPSALVTVLESAARSAELRGARVELQIAGEVEAIPAAVGREIAGTATAILARIGDGRVLITLTAGARDGFLFLAFPAPAPAPALGDPAPGLPAGTPMTHQWIDVVEESEEGKVCVEIRWGLDRAVQTSR
ncbi:MULTISPECIES: ATP-binding protein [unclassified Frankia]|uniref:ATP-binding protein n=1 Tax=unclassified Frankia TaxID=2632575 RepID=UPI001EF62608|nr:MULTISPECIES: ATP-binding protein [unclassified Frankia]